MGAISSAKQVEYRFGRFRLIPGERQLLADGKAVTLGPRAFDLLAVLVEHAGHLVSKDELHRLVWPGLVVEDNNLQVQVSALRKILGYEAIATIPGIGYRFVLALEADGKEAAGGNAADATPTAPAEPEAPPDAPSAAAATHHPAAKRGSLDRNRLALAIVAVLGAVGLSAWLAREWWAPALHLGASSPPALSIAVLPFRASAGEGEEAKFADALTQDVTSWFGKSAWVKVAPFSRASNFRGPISDASEAGRTLHVRYLMEGEVRRDGGDYIVTARLLDTDSGAQVWNRRIQVPLERPDGKTSIPHNLVAGELQGGLLNAATRRAVAEKASGSAVELSLRGWEVFDKAYGSADELQGYRTARGLFAQAVQLDSTFVPAMWGYVFCIVWEGFLDPFSDRDQLAREADQWSSRAIRADGSRVQAWRARTWALLTSGRWDEALAANDRALALEPENAWLLTNDRTTIYQFSGRPAEALAAAEKGMAINPDAAGDAYHYICKARLYLGQYDAAVAPCEKAAALADHWWIQFYLAVVYTHVGETAKAMIAKETLLKKQPEFSLARYRAMLRSSPPAFFELHEKHVVPAARKAGIPDK